jgi:hypothetical protein
VGGYIRLVREHDGTLAGLHAVAGAEPVGRPPRGTLQTGDDQLRAADADARVLVDQRLDSPPRQRKSDRLRIVVHVVVSEAGEDSLARVELAKRSSELVHALVRAGDVVAGEKDQVRFQVVRSTDTALDVVHLVKRIIVQIAQRHRTELGRRVWSELELQFMGFDRDLMPLQQRAIPQRARPASKRHCGIPAQPLQEGASRFQTHDKGNAT